jgi:hypothetical protein
LSYLGNTATHKTPLDSQLLTLAVRDAQGQEMPLAIRRFMEEYGAQRPVDAMQVATDKLLEMYQHSVDPFTKPISVEKICSLAGAELIGSRPSSRPHVGYNSEDTRPRVGHTGKLYFRNSRAVIKIPDEIEFETARISVAHEIGHLLIHRRGEECDAVTIRLSSSAEEEALSEYAARLLLLPSAFFWPEAETNLAQYAVERAGVAKVTIHSAVSRLGDPDMCNLNVRGAIFWKINPELPRSGPLYTRLTPRWHLCPGAFVPVSRSKARAGSLIAELADSSSPSRGWDIQTVNIGTFIGTFRVDVFAWGSVSEGTRSVLSVFRDLQP